MKVKDCMTKHVISVGTQEPVSVAARLMSRYNLGILPVQTPDGRLCGMVTDRDVVLRCVAAGKDAEAVPVREIMSTGVLAVEASDDTARAARLMSRAQLRRLPADVLGVRAQLRGYLFGGRAGGVESGIHALGDLGERLGAGIERRRKILHGLGELACQ